MVRREVGISAPCEEVVADDVAANLDLNAAVHHVAYVVVVAGVAERYGQRQAEEHVVGLVVVELDTTLEAALPEAEVNADVELGVLLPRDIGVTLRRRRHERHLVVGVRHGVSVGEEVVADEVVTVLTV